MLVRGLRFADIPRADQFLQSTGCTLGCSNANVTHGPTHKPCAGFSHLELRWGFYGLSLVLGFGRVKPGHDDFWFAVFAGGDLVGHGSSSG